MNGWFPVYLDNIHSPPNMITSYNKSNVEETPLLHSDMMYRTCLKSIPSLKTCNTNTLPLVPLRKQQYNCTIMHHSKIQSGFYTFEQLMEFFRVIYSWNPSARENSLMYEVPSYWACFGLYPSSCMWKTKNPTTFRRLDLDWPSDWD
jgi:hypothetical protein